MVQQEQRPIALRQRRQRLPHPFHVFGTEQGLLRSRILAVVELRTDERELSRASLRETRLVARQIVGHREQPRFRITRLRLQEADKRFLCDVLRLIRITNTSTEEANEAWVPLLEERTTGAHVLTALLFGVLVAYSETNGGADLGQVHAATPPAATARTPSISLSTSSSVV